MLEEPIQVLTFDDSGNSVVADIKGQVMFTEDGNIKGLPPPIVVPVLKTVQQHLLRGL